MTPKSSRFMGRRYRIEFCDKVAEGDRYGQTDHVVKLIQVENADHDQQREILLHEVLHQLCYMTEIQLDDEAEERVATLMARALIGHMRDNHSLWRWMLQRERNVRDANQ